MKNTCETCKHCREFKVIGMDVFPTICRSPKAKKYGFGIRFTEVMRSYGFIRSFINGTCGKYGFWWEPKSKFREYQSPVQAAPTKNQIDIDRRDQFGFPPIDSVRPTPRFEPSKDTIWLDELANITPKQWNDIENIMDKSNKLQAPARPVPPMPTIKPPRLSEKEKKS